MRVLTDIYLRQLPPRLEQLMPIILHPADQEFIARIGALRSPEVAANNPGRPPSRLPDAQSISEHFGRIVAGWIPHPFTPQEIQQARLDGLRYLIIVRAIEAVEKDIYPRQLPAETQAQLVFARQSYMLRYFRIFRMNDLPTEIISDILRLVIWDSMRQPVDARLRITWTCRKWRQIALADSTLWNAVWFRGSGALLDRAWAWFERARQAPLDVRIDGDPECEDADDEDADDDEDPEDDNSAVANFTTKPSTTAADMRQMLLRLFTKLSTIRMLIVVVDDWKSALVVLELLGTLGSSCGVPMLQRFELHRGGLKNEDRNALRWPKVIGEPFIGGLAAPSLSYLSLNGVPIDWSRSVLENLTTFDIRRLPATHSPDAARFREILANCPRLSKLSMDGAGPRFETSAEPTTPVKLPYLRTLIVADFSRQYAQFLFSQFSAPNVNDLTLMNLCGDDYLPFQITDAYSIQFDAASSGMAAMTRWLDSMPLLTYLRLANVANQFFGVFFRPHDLKTPVCPRLTVMDCQSLEPNIIVQWAKDRARFGTPIRKIYFSEELAVRLSDEQVKACRSLCVCAKLPRGAMTPEEEALSL
ncbi:hypothetical protein K438DRAFT_1800079 [Mycena galopus ATCC 62051]|nr:hypothetical protein K438DRAFT_1800079 [Mycena galopus ATCC 62051]